jgi:hypothetical protein
LRGCDHGHSWSLLYHCFFIIPSGVRLSPLGTAATTGLLYHGDCGATGEMKIGRGNRSTRRKPAPAPLCPPQIPYDQIRARTLAAAVESQARPDALGYLRLSKFTTNVSLSNYLLGSIRGLECLWYVRTSYAEGKVAAMCVCVEPALGAARLTDAVLPFTLQRTHTLSPVVWACGTFSQVHRSGSNSGLTSGICGRALPSKKPYFLALT